MQINSKKLCFPCAISKIFIIFALQFFDFLFMKARYSFLILAFLLCQSLFAQTDYNTILREYGNPKTELGLIYIDKQTMTLQLYDANGTLLRDVPMACGKNKGDKEKSGDFKTPEGVFSVQQIQDASKWGHDFHDGKGYIPNCYGNWFIRLKTGFNGIGIHGTHAPESIGTRATEGCIRLNNETLDEIKPYIKVGMTVIIGKDSILTPASL